MSTYKHTAIVSFNGHFPIDMLRYDRCSPLDQIDVSVIEQSFDYALDSFSKSKAVNVCLINNSKKPNWTVDRWASFGADLTISNCYKLD